MKPMSDKHFAILRRQMVELIEIQVELLSDELGQEALSEQVLAAMRRVPRHLFVAPSLASVAYQNTPLPIGFDPSALTKPFHNRSSSRSCPISSPPSGTRAF